jgi:hypothetical protein
VLKKLLLQVLFSVDKNQLTLYCLLEIIIQLFFLTLFDNLSRLSAQVLGTVYLDVKYYLHTDTYSFCIHFIVIQHYLQPYD